MSYMPDTPPGADRQVDLPPGIPAPPPGRFVGIDAGGSSTRVAVLADGRLASRVTAPPMNALLSADLDERLAGLIAPWVTAAGIGMPGIRSAESAARLAKAVSDRTGCPVYVTGDGETAWLGAFGGEPGIVVFAGTGSGATGCDGQRWARSGGHGFLLGDEGGAYWIGRSAVSAALRWEDGMGGSAAIRQAVIEAAGCQLAELVSQIHARPAGRSSLTRFAPVLTALAADDPVALSIAYQAAQHLADLAEALRRRLGPLPVCGMGGVLTSPVIWDRFAELTGAVRPVAPPETGAALLAGSPRAEFIRAGNNTLTLMDTGGNNA
jgi:glucosamine kinase